MNLIETLVKALGDQVLPENFLSFSYEYSTYPIYESSLTTGIRITNTYKDSNPVWLGLEMNMGLMLKSAIYKRRILGLRLILIATN